MISLGETMATTIAMQVEFETSPIIATDKSGWIDLDDVPLSKKLIKDLNDWANLYSSAVLDEVSRENKVAKDLILKDANSVENFNRRGLALFARLQDELDHDSQFEVVDYVPIRQS